MKVLIITRHYLSQSFGGPNCSKAFINAVANIFDDCTLLCPAHSEEVITLPFVQNTGLKVVACEDKRSNILKGISMYWGETNIWYRILPTFLSENKFDIIFIDHSFTASSRNVLNAIKNNGAKIITLHHNIESIYLRDDKRSILYRFPYNYYASKAEKECILYSDVNLTLTDTDANYFKHIFPTKADFIEVLGTHEYNNNISTTISTESQPIFVISGSLDAMQTETALETFFSEYLPILFDVCNDAKLIITGRNPSDKLKVLCNNNPNIKLVANPNDIEAIIKQGNYYIAPIYTGSGLKLRIMDALRIGLPVLAHDVSTRGYESLIKEGCIFSYCDKSSFKANLQKLVAQQKNHKEIKNIYEKYFSLRAGTNKLKSIILKHIKTI